MTLTILKPQPSRKGPSWPRLSSLEQSEIGVLTWAPRRLSHNHVVQGAPSFLTAPHSPRGRNQPLKEILWVWNVHEGSSVRGLDILLFIFIYHFVFPLSFLPPFILLFPSSLSYGYSSDLSMLTIFVSASMFSFHLPLFLLHIFLSLFHCPFFSFSSSVHSSPSS